MADKDPAFLFYPLNWLQGTASLMPDEKGVYMDLLCHQHQAGSLPNDEKRLARMVGLSVPAFAAIWLTLRSKFVDRPDNRLVNLKLEEVMTERSTKRLTTDHTRAILSRFAVLARGIKKNSPEILEEIKKEFNVADYEAFSIGEATERLNMWFTNQLTNRLTVRLPTRVENENKDKKGLEVDVGGVEGEEGGREGFSGPAPPPATPLPGAMLEMFAKAFPDYPLQEVKDYTACMQLGYQLADQLGCPWDAANNGRMEEVLGKWKEIVAWIPASTWFHTKSLSFLNDKFQDLIQAKNNGKTNGNTQQTSLRIVKPPAAGNGHDPTLVASTGFGEI